jgi:hypothetical protein
MIMTAKQKQMYSPAIGQISGPYHRLAQPNLVPKSEPLNGNQVGSHTITLNSHRNPIFFSRDSTTTLHSSAEAAVVFSSHQLRAKPRHDEKTLPLSIVESSKWSYEHQNISEYDRQEILILKVSWRFLGLIVICNFTTSSLQLEWICSAFNSIQHIFGNFQCLIILLETFLCLKKKQLPTFQEIGSVEKQYNYIKQTMCKS